MYIYSLFVTLDCNKSCPYCFIQKKKTTFDLSKLDKIDYNNYKFVSILGGEPGLLQQQEIEDLFNHLSYIPNDKLLVVTNGLFMDKYYDLYPNINYSYHITDLTNYKLYPYNNISNVIIVTMDNIASVHDFIQNNDVEVQLIPNRFEKNKLLISPKYNQLLRLSESKGLKKYPICTCKCSKYLFR